METPKETIGLTGGIGAGKSVLSRVLRCNGFKVIDCDTEAKRIMHQDLEVKNQLTSRFGKELYSESGTLDKKKLAIEIFTNGENRKYVNTVVHSAVKREIERFRSQSEGCMFIESAIMVTGGLTGYCDQIWIVTAPERLRIKRVEERDNLSKNEIKRRIESQENEIKGIKDIPIWKICNDDNHPWLLKVLEKVKKNINNQKYTLTC